MFRGFSCLLLLLLTVTTARADSYDDLRLKWQGLLVGVGYDTGDTTVSARLTSTASTANSYWASMDKSPTRTFLWSDAASTTTSSHITNSYSRLRAMALAYATPGCSLAGNATLLSDLLSALDWMHANRYNATKAIYDNWWDFEIGTPIQLTDLAVLLYDQLTSTQLNNFMGAVEKFTPSATTPAAGGTTGTFTGANRMWKIRAVAVRGAVVKNSSKLVAARDAFSALFTYVTSGDGFYTDGSFIQHTYHPYTAGYGASLIATMAPVLNWLSGSTWAVTDPAQANLYRWIFDSYEPMIYRGAAWDLVRGRECGRSNATPQSTGQSIMDSILQIAQFAPAAEAARMKRMLKGWALTDTVRDFVGGRPLPTLQFAQQLMADASIVPRGELLGHYTFAEMDRVVHLGAGYGFGVSMCSTRIANFESINGENLRGWFTGDGMTVLYNADLNSFSDAYYATIDQYRMPGVTADVTHNKLPAVPNSIGPRAQGQSTLSPHNWVGGVTLGRYGATGMQFKGVGVTLTGKKSWFMFDDEIVCLGAGLTSTDNRPIETTVENRKLSTAGAEAFTVNGTAKSTALGWSETMTGVTWAHLASSVAGADLGYYFPQAPTLKAVREARTGAWSDIDDGTSSTPITRNYLRIGFEHGSNPSNATYQYVLLPGRSARRVSQYAETPPISVLANNANVQAVSETALGLTAANFWTDTVQTAGLLTANKKCSVLVQNDGTFLEVAISDPSQVNTGSIDLQIAVNGATLVSADSGVAVTQTSPSIALTVNVNGAQGRTFKARFYFGTPQALTLTPVADAYVYDATASAGSNFGTATSLVVKKSGAGFNRESFLKFNVPAASGVLFGATLKLMPLSTSTPGVHGATRVDDTTWIESGTGGITWNNQPAASGSALSTWTPATNVPTSANVTAAIPGSGLVSFKVSATTETADGYVTYASRENSTVANRPQLVLSVGHTPPTIALTSPGDGDFLTHAGPVTIAADAQATDGAITSVAFYDGATLLGTAPAAPYQVIASLSGGTHWLTAVATDANGLSKTSLARRIDVSFPPTASPASVATPRAVPIDVNLRLLVSDVETPTTSLRFTLGAAANGTVALLADGYTARFTPATGYSGPASFAYTVTDVTNDDRTVLNYGFQNADLADTSGQGRVGTSNIQGTGATAFATDAPAALGPQLTSSLQLTENGTLGAARLERSLTTAEVDLQNANWTLAGWFKRSTAANMDVLLHLGDSGGFGNNALTLGFYSSATTLELRNYSGTIQDVAISKTNVTTGAWHHFAIVRSGGTLSLYVDGTSAGSASASGFTFTNSKPVKWGGPGSTSVLDRWWNGSLADLAIFSDALSAAELARLGTLPVAYFGGQSASSTVTVAVRHPPTAASAAFTAPRNTATDIDLLPLIGDADTPLSVLRLTVGSPANGTVTLLADGHTARFTPTPGYTGPATFAYAVLDTTADPRTFLNYRFQSASAADSSGNGRDGTLNLQGSGGATFPADVPPALAPQHTQSLFLTENGSAGAARVERVITAGELDLRNADWTLAGWFKRTGTTTIDSLLQLGESGGWGSSALSLVLPVGSTTLELRNYAGATQDVSLVKTGIGTGLWHHFAIVRSGATLSLYVNGALAGSDSDFTFTFDATKPLKLGGVFLASGGSVYWDRWLHGGLADFAAFSAALSPSEILRLATHPAANLGGQTAGNTVTLNVVTAIEDWRMRHFGTTSNSGLAADAFDRESDGLANLVEFAIGTNPTAPDAAPWSTSRVGATLEFIYPRSKSAMADLTYVVEWSDTLAAPWSTTGVSAPALLSDDGTTQQVKVTVPAGSGVTRRFVRLRVTRP